MLMQKEKIHPIDTNGIKKIVFDNVVGKFYENLSIYPLVLDKAGDGARNNVWEIRTTFLNTGLKTSVKFKTAMDCMFLQKR